MHALVLALALAMLPALSIAAEPHVTNQDREAMAKYYHSSHGQGQPQLFAFSDGTWGLSDGMKLTRVMTDGEFRAWKSALDTSSYAFSVAQNMENNRESVFQDVNRNQPKDKANPKILVAVYVQGLEAEFIGGAYSRVSGNETMK